MCVVYKSSSCVEMFCVWKTSVIWFLFSGFCFSQIKLNRSLAINLTKVRVNIDG